MSNNSSPTIEQNKNSVGQMYFLFSDSPVAVCDNCNACQNVLPDWMYCPVCGVRFDRNYKRFVLWKV